MMAVAVVVAVAALVTCSSLPPSPSVTSLARTCSALCWNDVRLDARRDWRSGRPRSPPLRSRIRCRRGGRGLRFSNSRGLTGKRGGDGRVRRPVSETRPISADLLVHPDAILAAVAEAVAAHARVGVRQHHHPRPLVGEDVVVLDRGCGGGERATVSGRDGGTGEGAGGGGAAAVAVAVAGQPAASDDETRTPASNP